MRENPVMENYLIGLRVVQELESRAPKMDPEALIDALPEAIPKKRPDALDPAEYAEIAAAVARIDA